MKKILIFVSTVVIASFMLLSACSHTHRGADYVPFDENDSEYHFQNLYPNLEGYVLPEDGDEEALKSLAYRLYSVANELAQKCPRRAEVSVCDVTTTGVEVIEQIMVIKNGDEYLKSDYQQEGKIMGITASPSHGKLTYAHIDLDQAYFIKVTQIDDSGERFTADWSEVEEQKWVDKPYFHSSQELLFQESEMWVLPETIKSVTITHDDEKGFWHIEQELDVSNPKTTEITLANLRASSDSTKKAKYTSVVQTIEIWDNGLFKSFASVDKWNAGIFVSSVIDYRSYISYSESACDLSKMDHYPAIAAEAKAAAEQKQAEGQEE